MSKFCATKGVVCFGFCTAEDDNCSLCNSFYNRDLWYPSLEKSLGTSFIRSVVFELVYAFARSRD